MSDLPVVIVYSDGACHGNPGPGGYAAIVVRDGQEMEVSGAEESTTNNRMELTAAICGLETLKERSNVRMVTDSQYLAKGMTEWIHNWIKRGWKTAQKKAVLNRDLWERLHRLSQEHEMQWVWVRGHSGHEYNERCDQLANAAIFGLQGER